MSRSHYPGSMPTSHAFPIGKIFRPDLKIYLILPEAYGIDGVSYCFKVLISVDTQGMISLFNPFRI